MNDQLLYQRNENPFGRTWEKWASKWCEWMLSIPKKNNPSLDVTGEYSSFNQNDKFVWFLTGSFGNIVPIKRKCKVPEGRAILFPILEKEDSLAEDSDLKTDTDLIKRSREATDKVLYMEAAIDGQDIEQVEDYRVQSEVFDLIFPQDNVYDVKPGLTRSVCDGYWIFIKPLQSGKHTIHFKGENLLSESYTTNQLKRTEVFSQIRTHIDDSSTFKLDVLYELTIVN
jgi:hypothetical protein